MAKHRRWRFLDYPIYLLVTGLQKILLGLSLPRTQRIGRALGRWAGRLDRRHFRRVKDHLRLAFPDWDAATVHSYAVRSFEHLGSLLAEILWLPNLLKAGDYRQFVDTDALDLLREKLGRRNFIFVTGHIGNWEWGGVAAGYRDFNLHSVMRPLDNPYLNRIMVHLREIFRQSVVPKAGALMPLMRILHDGGSVALVADQNAGADGVFVDFFGRQASTIGSVAAIALKTGVPIAVMTMQREPAGGKFKIHFEDLIEMPADLDKSARDQRIHDITQRFTTALEAAIRRHPEQWLWAHRRWKSRPPEEREQAAAPVVVASRP